MSDRSVRSLEYLERSASTARVLNLLKISRENRDSPEWRERPLFQTPALNTCLLIKHRLRRNEIDAFRGRRQTATKVIVPIDNGELRSGGRYFFVDQINFEATLSEVFGIQPGHPDVNTLRLMDKLPSLDPFLMREQLRRSGIDPAPCYFALSDADLITVAAALAFGGTLNVTNLGGTLVEGQSFDLFDFDFALSSGIFSARIVQY
jgi:hypothetical protein